MLKERINAGLARARAQGKHLGRKRQATESGAGHGRDRQEAPLRHGPRPGCGQGSRVVTPEQDRK
jgi:hypothetical protein